MTPHDAAASPQRTGVVARRANRRFVALSAATLVGLAAGAVIVCERIAESTALSDAKVRGATLASTVAAPLVDQRVHERDGAAMARLGAVLERSMEVSSVAHVRLWTPQGRILWSDEPELVGRTYELEPVVVDLFDSQRTVAELSALDRAENETHTGEAELLEVYTGTHDADGRPLVFEMYYTTDEMRARERDILWAILPVAVGGLLLFQATVLPLALSLARHVERGERQRVRLLRQTVLTTQRERLRIARDLHDGVVQDLAGLCYALPAVAAQLPDTPEARTSRETVAAASDILARDVESLRSLLVDIHPPGLEGQALRDAIEDLAERSRRAGPDVSVEMPEQPDWSVDVGRVVYRVVQEALRNVVAHADAAHAWVVLAQSGHAVRVTVADDGRGLAPAVTEGHVGLSLLRDHLEDLGGALAVRQRAGGGTLLAADVPVDLLGEH
ncbi:MAG: sensor histidine kinase [Phycicoccus sp.]